MAKVQEEAEGARRDEFTDGCRSTNPDQGNACLMDENLLQLLKAYVKNSSYTYTGLTLCYSSESHRSRNDHTSNKVTARYGQVRADGGHKSCKASGVTKTTRESAESNKKYLESLKEGGIYTLCQNDGKLYVACQLQGEKKELSGIIADGANTTPQNFCKGSTRLELKDPPCMEIVYGSLETHLCTSKVEPNGEDYIIYYNKGPTVFLVLKMVNGKPQLTALSQDKLEIEIKKANTYLLPAVNIKVDPARPPNESNIALYFDGKKCVDDKDITRFYIHTDGENLFLVEVSPPGSDDWIHHWQFTNVIHT